jgi:hypothetical protein
LGLGVRQIKRLIHIFREQGPPGLISKRRGCASNRRIKDEVKNRIMDLVRESYYDFGPVFAVEKLIEIDPATPSITTVRKWMIEAGFHHPRRSNRKKPHPQRERRPRFGELVQIDGSPHDWFEGRSARCTLLVFIDDATGRVLMMRFVPAETTEAYMDALRLYLERYGRPVSFYSDRHSIFVNNTNEPKGDCEPTQFCRALQALDIELIPASTPQAKGRVERVNKTLQKRLTRELRLAGIDCADEANQFVDKVYLKRFNQKFSVPPTNPNDAHRPLLHDPRELDLILSHQERRIISKSLSIQYKNLLYQLLPDGLGLSMMKAPVTVCESSTGQITILYKGHSIAYRVLYKGQCVTPSADGKSLDQRVEQALQKQRSHPFLKPAPDHPWRHSPIGKAAFSSRNQL